MTEKYQSVGSSLYDTSKPMNQRCIGNFRVRSECENICKLLNEQDADLMMQREKVLYWRNKAEDIFGDMQTNVELKKENIKLKERIKELEQANKQLKDTYEQYIYFLKQCGDVE